MKQIRLSWSLSLLLAALFLIINKVFFPIKEIIPLEFARSSKQMNDIISRIDPAGNGFQVLKMNTLVDFGFLVAYTLLAYFAFRQLIDVFQVKMSGWMWGLILLPGLLDVVENLFLLKSALDGQAYYSLVFYWVVRIKWAFGIVHMLLFPMMLAYVLIILFRNKKNAAVESVR